MGINIFALIIGAIFVNNVVLAQFLGICPFLGVSKDVKSSIGMGGAVFFVMLLATLVTYLIYYYILVPFNLGYLQTIAYILVIAGLVQMVEIILKKIAPAKMTSARVKPTAMLAAYTTLSRRFIFF